MQHIEYCLVCKSFSQLTSQELHRALRLRIDVFMIDQKCMVNDLDDLDEHAHHLLMKQEKNTGIRYVVQEPSKTNVLLLLQTNVGWDKEI